MSSKIDKEIEQIKETQDALRESIQTATELTAKAQRLLQKRKRNLQEESDATAFSGRTVQLEYWV